MAAPAQEAARGRETGLRGRRQPGKKPEGKRRRAGGKTVCGGEGSGDKAGGKEKA